MRLHLGCGTKKIDGWVNIDSVAGVGPDLVHDLTKPLPYPDNSIDEILAEDLLEHFDKYMRMVVMSDWARVLKVDGRMTLQVPNFKKILYRYFKFGFDNFVDFIFGENLWNSKVYIGHFGNHKWGYSEASLKAFVRQFAIEPEEVSLPGLNIRLVGKKLRNLSVSETDMLPIYSHANKFGPGPDVVTFAEARQKIQEYENNLQTTDTEVGSIQ